LIILKAQERELIEELRSWLPKKMFDAHVHCRPPCLSDHNLFNRTAKNPGETFSYFSWREHQKITTTLFPGFVCKFIVFSFVFFPNETKNNFYIRELAERTNNIVPVFTATAESNFLAEIKNNIYKGFKGLKIKIEKKEKQKINPASILDFYPMKVFELLNSLKSFAIIHLPENIFYDSDELIFLAREYNNMAFIIAHMGNSYLYQDGFDIAMEKIVLVPNIFFDTSMVTDEKVIATAISILGHKRILYGSDAPYSYLRGEFNYGKSGKILFDPEICLPWVDKERHRSYREMVDSFTMVYVNSLMAIKKALGNTKRDNTQIKTDIFYQNLLSVKII